MSGNLDYDEEKISIKIVMYDKDRQHNIPGFLGKSIRHNSEYDNEEIKEFIQKGLKIIEK